MSCNEGNLWPGSGVGSWEAGQREGGLAWDWQAGRMVAVVIY